MDIFAVIYDESLPKDLQELWRLHYEMWLTQYEEVKDKINYSERSYYRKKRYISNMIVEEWQKEQRASCMIMLYK